MIGKLSKEVRSRIQAPLPTPPNLRGRWDITLWKSLQTKRWRWWKETCLSAPKESIEPVLGQGTLQEGEGGQVQLLLWALGARAAKPGSV